MPKRMFAVPLQVLLLGHTIFALQPLQATDQECQDDVILRECDDKEIPKYSRSKMNNLVAILTTTCEYQDIEYRWKLTRVEDEKIIENYFTGHVFVINPFTLKKGFYSVEVYVKVWRKGVVKEFEMVPCGFEVIGLDPVASIAGGDERVVTAGHSFEVDGSSSINRDAPANATGKLIYKWDCDVKDLCLKQHTESIFKVPAEYAVKNQKYNFTLSVKTEDSETWVTATQTVTILSEASELVIICEKNCPPTSSKTNSKKLTFLRVKCLRNCYNLEAFQWSVDEGFDYAKGTQFGRNSDRFIIKENVLQPGQKYKIRVKLEDRGEAATVLDVHSAVKINECQVEPNEGNAIDTKFKVSCQYTGEGHSFEIFATKDDKKVILTKKATLESLEFVLPANTAVFCKITDIEGFEDTYELSVSVKAPSSKTIKDVVDSLPLLVKTGDYEAVIQITNAIFEANPKMKSLIKNLDEISMTSQDHARQISHMVTKIVYDPDAESNPYQGEIATRICKKAAEIDFKYLREETHPTSLSHEVTESSKNLMSCAQTDTKENFKILEPVPLHFNLTTPFPPLLLPVIEEEYPDYDIDTSVTHKTRKYESASRNFVGICETNLKMMALTVVEGEETVVAEGGTSCAQITRMVGKKLATMRIDVHGATFRPSRDLDKFDDAVDVMICSWENDPFWWNIEGRVVATSVFLVKITRNGKDITKFEDPNRFVLNLREEVPLVHDIDIVGRSVLRVDVQRSQGFFVQFHLDQGSSFRVLLTHFDKPNIHQVEKKGVIVTENDNILYQEHTFDYDSWYYVSVLPKINGTEGFNYRVSIFTKACYLWSIPDKRWKLACKSTPFSNEDKIQCSCQHLSILGAIIYNNMYKIDEILTDTDFEMEMLTSHVIFITVSTVLAVYSVLLTIMVREKLVTRAKIYILADISSSSRYVYLLGIKTGRKFHSGTSSNICVKLYGTLNKSRSHVLNYPDPLKCMFQRGNTDWFILATLEHLGDLEEVALWSDYSGRNPRWFCTNVTIYDLQTNQRWYFEVNRWFDLPPDGEIYVRSRVAQKEKEFSFLPNRYYMLKWSCSTYQAGFSVFQQLTLLVSIFLTIFSICLLLHGVPRLKLSDGFAKIQDYEFHLDIIWVSVAAPTITFFLHVVLIWAFRKSYYSWYILTLILISSIVLLVTFGFWVPRLEAWFWLTSAIASIVIYFFVLENIYGFIVSLVNYEKTDNWVRNLHKITQPIRVQRAYLFEKFGENLLRPYFSHLYKPIDDDEIKERKLRIEAKRKFLVLLEDTVMFACYVTLLYLAIYAHKNPQRVANYKEMVDLLSGYHTRTQSYGTIQSLEDIYKYVNKTLIPTIHAHQWYSKFILKDPAILADFHNKLLGVARIRQKRVVIETKRQEFAHSEQSFDSFGPENGSLVRLSKIWNYTLAKDAGYTVCVGKFGTYFGGGFIAPLGRTWFNSYANLVYLVNNYWLGSGTSVVMIEFLVYNVNSNLFTSVRFIFERSATGFLRKQLDLETSQFLFVKDEARVAQVAILAFFLFILCVFTLKLLVRLFKSKLLVLKDLWTLVDLTIVGMSYSCFVLFTYRAASVGRFLDKIEKLKKNEFINYFPLLDEELSFTLVSAFLVFVATIRLWKACRFGTVFKIMEKTLVLSFLPLVIIFLTHVIILMAFTLSAYVIFSYISRSFRDIPDTLISLMLLQIGLQDDFDFEGLISDTPFLGRIYYAVYMILSTIYLTVYIAVIVICYAEANDIVSSGESDFTNLRRHIFQEVSFYKSSIKAAFARLRAGSRRQRLFVTPKPDDVRYANCMTLPSNTLELMTCIAIHEIRKLSLTENQKVKLMQRVVGSLRDSDKFHVFFSEKTEKRVKVIHDYRIRRVAVVAQMILSNDEERRKKGEKRYKRAVEQQMNKLNFVVKVLDTVTHLVSNIEIE